MEQDVTWMCCWKQARTVWHWKVSMVEIYSNLFKFMSWRIQGFLEAKGGTTLFDYVMKTSEIWQKADLFRLYWRLKLRFRPSCCWYCEWVDGLTWSRLHTVLMDRACYDAAVIYEKKCSALAIECFFTFSVLRSFLPWWSLFFLCITLFIHYTGLCILIPALVIDVGHITVPL